MGRRKEKYAVVVHSLKTKYVSMLMAEARHTV